MSLRLRLVLFLSLALTLMLTAVGGGLYLQFETREKTAMDEGLKRTALEVLRSVRVSEPLFFPYQEVILPDVDVFTFPNTMIEIRRLDGRVVARSSSLEGFRLPIDAALIGAVQNGRSVYTTVIVDRHPLRLYAAPINVDGRPIGLITVAGSLAPLERTLFNLRLALASAMLFLVVAVAGVTYVVVGRELQPLGVLIKTVADIQSGDDLSRRVSSRGKTAEVQELVAQINAMLERLDAAYRRLAETLKAQKRFIADASHELRTPLTAMRGNLEFLRHMLSLPDVPSNDVQEVLADLADDVERMVSLTEQLLALARADASRGEEQVTFDVGAWYEALVARLVRRYAGRRSEVALVAQERLKCKEGHTPLVGRGRPEALASAVELLVENALKYTDRGNVTVRGCVDGEALVVKVQDTGIGIPADDLAHVAERFYRASNALSRPGTGLGLSIVRAVAEAHGGALDVDSREGEGTTVTLRLPIVWTGGAPEDRGESGGGHRE
ncbi:MAG: HAMP domain-containing histidine kinase [Hydrogenibacillus sp.]|nr:HAMP domain-containing histidine kinase [Hydrogenibacillus sp.]